MKIKFLFFLFFFFNTIFSQEKSSLLISNVTHKQYTIYDYITQDSLFTSAKTIDTLLIDNNKHKRTLLLFVDNKPSLNIVILDQEKIELEILENESLKFTNSTTNSNLKKYQEKLNEIKLLENPQAAKNYTYNYYLKNNRTFIALEYAHSSILYNIYSKDSCIQLFENLDSSLAEFDLWGQTINLLYDERKFQLAEDNLQTSKTLNTKTLNIYFDTEEASLSFENKRLIDSFFQDIAAQNIEKIKLVGFADERGNEEVNQKLSKERVLSLENYIKSFQTISENLIILEAKGEIYNENLQESRKVEITVNYFLFNKVLAAETDSTNLIFEYQKANLTENHNKLLNKIFYKWNKNKHFKIHINGFSCGHEGTYTFNNKKSNLTLSEARTKLTKNYFIRNGVPESNIIATPLGVDVSIEKKDSDHDLKRHVIVYIKK